MKISKLLSFLFLGLLLPLSSFSQEIEMADGLRQSGKIYVVVLILVIILLGLISYLFYLDKKVSKIENSEKS